MAKATRVHSTPPASTPISQNSLVEDAAADLPEYILYDDERTAYPAEAFAYVIGRAAEDLMSAAAGKAVQSLWKLVEGRWKGLVEAGGHGRYIATSRDRCR